MVAGIGERVLRPGTGMSAGLLAVRLREQGAVRDNIDRLLGAREPSLAMAAEQVEDPSFDPGGEVEPAPRPRTRGNSDPGGGHPG